MKIFWTIAVLAVVIGGGWYFYSSQYSSPEPPQQQAPVSSAPLPETSFPAAAPSAGKEILVEMTPSGFSPANLTIKTGDTVKFVNKDTKNHWPASAVHPIHGCYQGFDALEGIQPGQSYSFTFKVAKTCGFHDHLNPGLKGSITVQ